jgi:hypothetical protein
MPVKKTRNKPYTGKNTIVIEGVSDQLSYLFKMFSRRSEIGSEADLFEKALLAYQDATTDPDQVEANLHCAELRHKSLKEIAILKGLYEPK